ncbi:hypothetical protein AB0M34_35470 [Nocardia sp. NPDC050193]
MARFQRLTRADLETLTRDQLLERLTAEQKYWARQERGMMTEADRQARAEFTRARGRKPQNTRSSWSCPR